MNWLLNLGIYQAVWFVGVFGGDSFAWVGLLLLGVHFLLTPYKIADGFLVCLFLCFGLLLDGALAYFGFFSFKSPVFPIPLWLMSIWAVLATLPNHSLSWLKNRHFLNFLFGAMGGPLAYWAGVRFGAAQFNEPLLDSLLLLAIAWALFWPLAMLLSNYSISWAVSLSRAFSTSSERRDCS